MGVKYVKDFSFPTTGGFHGDVQRYAKGGHVTKVPAKAKASAKDMPARAKPNAPARGAPKMASKPATGKRQGYNEGGRVPGYEMDRLPTKRPPGRMKDLAPARRFKGDYQGYAEGGPVDEILPGDGRGGLDAVPLPPLKPLPPDDPRLLPSLPPGYEPPRLGGDELPEFLRPVLQQRPIEPPVGDLMPLPEEPQYLVPEEPVPYREVRSGPRMERWSDGTYNYLPEETGKRTPLGSLPDHYRRLNQEVFKAERGANRREMVGARGEMARPRGLGRAVMRARDKIASRAAVPRMGIPQPYMPSISATTPEESDAYFKSIGRMPSPGARFAKGGEVKGKKIAKVMGEYKRGELRSGSKKGPKVTNPKQAMAIALAQSRSKKAEGGLTSYEESGSAGGSNVSFKEAFRKAREQGLKEFSWKGDRYTTKVREESSRESKVEDKAPRAEMGRKGPESRGGKRNVTEMSEYKRERKTELPSDRGSGFRSQAEETGMSASERADKARGYAENLMNVAGAGALLREPAKAAAKSLMRKGMEFVGGRKMKKEAAETAARKSTPEYKEKAAQMEKFAEQMRARQKMGARYAEGGEIDYRNAAKLKSKGIFNDEGMAYESKGPKTRYTAAKGRRQSKERAMERRALDKARHAEMYAPGMSLDMADRKNRGGMPVHRRKPMYGGGKC